MDRFYKVIAALLFLSLFTFAQPKSAMNSLNKAQEAFRNGQTDQGWKHLQKSMKKGKGTYYQPFIYAGDYMFRSGEYDLALNYYNDALDIQELSSVFLKKSIVHKYQFDWEESIANMEEYLARAKLSRERYALAELELENLKFTRDQYIKYENSGFNFNIQLLSFSTEQLEYFPTITGGDEHLIYTHRYTDGSKPTDENLFEGALDGISKYGIPLEGNLNSRLNEGASSISADGAFMVLTVCNRPDGAGSCDLYYSNWNPLYGWETPKPLPGKINTGRWESQPSLGPDGRTIYFVRASDSMDPDADIFISTKDDEGNWSKGQRLPVQINSTDKESSPFIHFDGNTLYFRSERSPSLGGSDFFMSKRLNDTLWSEAINLGFPLNSYGDEFSMVIDKSGTFGYLASDRGNEILPDYSEMNSLDLYRFELPTDLQPEPRFNYDIVVYDSLTSFPLGNVSVQLYNDAGIQFFNGQSNENTGLVRLMTDGSAIRVTAYKRGYVPYSTTISSLDYVAHPLHGPNVAALRMTPIASGNSFVLRNILFELDKSVLLAESEKELKALLKLLEDNPNIEATIIGHTDNQGAKAYNQNLSEARARAVLNWLVSKGINRDRLISMGKGMDEPVASNDTEWGRALNRRTEVKLR